MDRLGWRGLESAIGRVGHLRFEVLDHRGPVLVGPSLGMIEDRPLPSVQGLEIGSGLDEHLDLLQRGRARSDVQGGLAEEVPGLQIGVRLEEDLQ